MLFSCLVDSVTDGHRSPDGIRSNPCRTWRTIWISLHFGHNYTLRLSLPSYPLLGDSCVNLLLSFSPFIVRSQCTCTHFSSPLSLSLRPSCVYSYLNMVPATLFHPSSTLSLLSGRNNRRTEGRGGRTEGWRKGGSVGLPPCFARSPGEGGNNGSHTGEGGERSDYCLVGSQRYRSAQKYVVRERGTVSDIIYTPETAGAEAHTHNNTKYQPGDAHVHTQIQNTHRRRGLRTLEHKHIYVNPLLETRAAKMHSKHTHSQRPKKYSRHAIRKYTQCTNDSRELLKLHSQKCFRKNRKRSF